MDNTALVIVDIQVGAFDGIKISPVKNGNQFIKNVVDLIKFSRDRNIPVIYIQDCGKVGGAFEKDTEHWQIHPEISPQKGDLVIPKTTSNAFFETSLDESLRHLGVRSLVMCGLHSEGCFNTTCKEALKMGFEVIVTTDGHATAQDNYIEVTNRISSELEVFGASNRLTIEILNHDLH